MQITIRFMKEQDGRWTADCLEIGYTVSRDSLDEVRHRIWEWLRDQINHNFQIKGEISMIERAILNEVSTLAIEPWKPSIAIGDEGRAIIVAIKNRPMLAVQWNGENMAEVMNLTKEYTGILTDTKHLILKDDGGKYVMEVGDWILRNSDGKVRLRPDHEMVRYYDLFNPEIPPAQLVPVSGVVDATGKKVDGSIDGPEADGPTHGDPKHGLPPTPTLEG